MIEPDFNLLALCELVGQDKSFKINGQFQYDSLEDTAVPTNIEPIGTAFSLPTKVQIEAKAAELKTAWVSAQYQRMRQPEYPPLTDLADALYWQQKGDDTKMTAYLAAIQAVKEKYPKE